MNTYEQKYKEALERAKAFKSPYCQDVVEQIFPELRESEDERIRKELKRAIAVALDYSYFDKETADNCIAWLEKQGHDGKKWIYEDVYLKEKEQLFQDGIDEVLENPQKFGLEKQGKQKSIDMSIKEKAHQIAWETSKHYDPLLSKESWCEMAALDMASWLEKQDEQKPAWSEEDYTRLNNLIGFIQKYGLQYYASTDKVIDWLKSLKPNHWKPSEEQMEGI